jgi:hypothetical protein
MKHDLVPYYSQFQKVEKELKQQDSTQAWEIRVSYFPDEEESEGLGIRVSKSDWPNQVKKNLMRHCFLIFSILVIT